MKEIIVNFVNNKSLTIMNSAEIKLELFRKIDNLKEDELEKVYNKFLSLLNTASVYHLTKEENIAIEEALQAGNTGKQYTHEEVMGEAKRKYPNLRFR